MVNQYIFVPRCINVGFDITRYQNTSEHLFLFNFDSWLEVLMRNETIFNSCNQMGTNPNFGVLMLCPILIASIFILGQWLKMEDSTKKRFYTFPWLLFQVYPQYRTIKVLYMALWKRDIRWKKEKAALGRNLRSLGNFL